MGVNLRECKSFTVDDWSGGLNEFTSPFKLNDNELASCKNMSIQTSGSLKSSLGYVPYSVRQEAIDIVGIKGGHRYTASDGTRKVIIYASDEAGDEISYGVYADSNDGVFAKIGQILSTNGKCRFAQYRDTVFMSTLGDPPVAYDGTQFFTPGAENRWSVLPGYFARPEKVFDADPSTGDLGFGEGSLDTANAYYYRYTFDYGFKDFVGESSPLVTSIAPGDEKLPVNVTYMEDVANFLSDTTNDGGTVFKKPAKIENDFIVPLDVQRINIYRSIAMPRLKTNSDKKQIEVFYIGSVSRARYNSVSAGTILFTDGGVGLERIVEGPTAEYNKMTDMPRAKFIAYHNSRMWSANVYFDAATEDPFKTDPMGDWVTAPHSVMFSTINNHGNSEPAVYRSDFIIEIDPTDGEGITGMFSYRRNLLIVFKANSMWAITGDTPGNFAVRNIDARIGCISNETIDVVDGMLVWLSNAGVYYFDGSKPCPLKTDNISKSLADIPNHKKVDACGIYDIGHREYLLAHSGKNLRSRNLKVSRFSLRTGTWAQEEQALGTGLFLIQNMPNEKVQVLACRDDDLTYASAPIHKFDVGTLTNIIGTGAGNIAFEFQTKFYDDGKPYMNKDFKAVFFEMQSPGDLALHVVCDNRMDTRLDDGGGFVITKPVTNDLIWADGTEPYDDPPRSDQQKWYLESGENENTNIWANEVEGGVLVMLDTRCWGKRISLIITTVGGYSVRNQVEIQSITVFYKPREGIRQ